MGSNSPFFEKQESGQRLSLSIFHPRFSLEDNVYIKGPLAWMLNRKLQEKKTKYFYLRNFMRIS